MKNAIRLYRHEKEPLHQIMYEIVVTPSNHVVVNLQHMANMQFKRRITIQTKYLTDKEFFKKIMEDELLKFVRWCKRKLVSMENEL